MVPTINILIISILDFIKTLYSTLKRFLQGTNVIVSEEKRTYRLTKCLNCVHIMGTNDKKYRCRLCKCYLYLKIRTETSKCPIGEW